MKIWKFQTSTILCSILLLLLVSPSIFGQQWSGNNNLDDNLFRNGNIGIGSSTPESPLHIISNQNQGLILERSGKNSIVKLLIANGDYGYLALGGGAKLRGFDNPSSFGGNLSVGAGGNTWLTDYQLEVTGTTNLTDKLFFNNKFTIESVVEGANQNDYLKFFTANPIAGEKGIYISTGGNLIVGTVDPSLREGYNLDVGGKTNTDSLSIDDTYDMTTYTGGNKNYLQLGHKDSSNAAIYISPQGNMILGNNQPETVDTFNTFKLIVDGNARINNLYTDSIFNASSSYAYSLSDRRLKKDIELMPNNSLNKFMQVKLYEYEYKHKVKGRRLGIMAQEMKELLPTTVGSFINSDGQEFLNFNPSDLHYLHMKATQEMNETIIEQEETIENLTQENEQLQERMNNLENQMNEIYKLLAQSDKEEVTNTGLNTKFIVGQNIPNPSDKETFIPYFIPENTSSATLTITDIQGNVLSEQSIKTVGNGNMKINTAAYPTGTYLYFLTVDGNKTDSKKMIIE